MSSESSEPTQQEVPSQQATTSDNFERIQRASEARQRLEEEIIGFLRRMKEGGESELGRIPDAEDLLPYFQRYAWAIIESKHKAAILAAPTLSESKARMRTAVDSVLTAICKRSIRDEAGNVARRAGVWRRTVKIAADAVNLGHWATPFGEYSRSIFMHPKRSQLRVFLLVQMQTLIQEFSRSKSRESATTRSNRIEERTEIQPNVPKRAQWLNDHLRQRGWNVSDLNRKGGPDRKTITKVLRGEEVREDSLDAILRALNKFHANPPLPSLSLSDIPK